MRLRRSTPGLRLVAGAVAFSGIGLFALAASARGSVELPWPLPQVYGTALRFVRVDRGCKITDKDPDAAFVMFECPNDDPHDKDRPAHHGALELVPVRVQGRDGVRAQVTLSDDPHYMEGRFLELFERKVKDERGPVPPPVKEEKPAPPPATDGGAS